MNAITFDTHPYIKRLKQEGITEPQAEIFADMVKAAQNTDISHLATKEELKEAISGLRAELKSDNVKIIMWLVGMSFAQTAMIVSLLKLH